MENFFYGMLVAPHKIGTSASGTEKHARPTAISGLEATLKIVGRNEKLTSCRGWREKLWLAQLAAIRNKIAGT